MQNLAASRVSEPEEPAPFLGVERSLSGKFWRQRASDERMGLAIAQRLQLPEPIGRLLASRGQTLESAEGSLALPRHGCCGGAAGDGDRRRREGRNLR